MPKEARRELNDDSALVPSAGFLSFCGVLPPIHVIDFEGTRESGILEFGLATVQAGVIESTGTRLCAPTGEIHPADRRRHGLSRERLAGHAPFSAQWPLFSGLRRSGPFCAHNASVEDGLIRSVWAHPGSAPDFSEGRSDARWGPWLDTLSLYRVLFPGFESHALEDLIEASDLTGELNEVAATHCPQGRRRYHCALYDALASALLLLRLLDDPAFRECRLSWWLAQSAPSKAARENLEQGELF